MLESDFCAVGGGASSSARRLLERPNALPAFLAQITLDFFNLYTPPNANSNSPTNTISNTTSTSNSTAAPTTSSSQQSVSTSAPPTSSIRPAVSTLDKQAPSLSTPHSIHAQQTALQPHAQQQPHPQQQPQALAHVT